MDTLIRTKAVDTPRYSPFVMIEITLMSVKVALPSNLPLIMVYDTLMSAKAVSWLWLLGERVGVVDFHW